MSYKIFCGNMGLLYDYRNVLLRSGATSLLPEVQSQYNAVKTLFEAQKTKYESDAHPKLWQENPEFHVTDDEKEIIAASRLKKIKAIYKVCQQHCDIVLLQEMEHAQDIELVRQSLNSFAYVYGQDSNGLSTLVAWNTKRFSKIAPDASVPQLRKATWVTLQDNVTRKILQVASVHLSGYYLMDPQSDFLVNDHLAGDEQVNNLLSRIGSSTPQPDLSIIAGDFNSEYKPCYHNDKSLALSQRRFTLLENNGFTRFPQEVQTAFNKDVKPIPGRENGLCQLDHLFLRTKEAATHATVKLCIKARYCYPLEDVSKNPSDHKPLFYKITLG